MEILLPQYVLVIITKYILRTMLLLVQVEPTYFVLVGAS
jgi:hypothetical protein